MRQPRGEREAIRLANARVFTLTSGNLRGQEMAAMFVAHLAEMEQLIANLAPPFVAIVGADSVRVVWPAPTK